MYGTVLPQRWALDLMADKSAVNVIRFFFSSRRRHTRLQGDWSSDVCCLPEFPAGCDRAEPSTAPDPSAPECGKIPKARGLHIHLVLGGAPAGRFNSGARPGGHREGLGGVFQNSLQDAIERNRQRLRSIAS